MKNETARVRVLIADDVAEIRRILRRILERDGRFEIVGEARDGIEAVQLAADLLPHIVLLDLMMPKRDGATALRQIRSLSPGSKVVLFTGIGAERADRLGADVCLEKGVSPEEIIRSLEGLI